MTDKSSFELLHPLLRHHIVNSLGWTNLRSLQEYSIRAILAGSHCLLIAPTAGGKTEAAAFPLLSQLLSSDKPGFAVLYVCPLKALLNNLFERLDGYCSMVGLRAGLWHGDVSSSQRRKLVDHPPHILLTTPESLEAMLISQKGLARERLKNVRTVVVDEIHAFARDDRGIHMLSVLERIQALAGKPIHRIGLSATVGNPEELLHWLVNSSPGQLEVVRSEGEKAEIDVQLDYVGNLENAATVISRLHQGEKRLVFCDSRRRVEELGVALRALGIETFLSHSSLSREQRLEAEKAFAESRDCVIVATSTLELGIDVGDLDRVIQIDSPNTVASFLQRLGRTGRRPGTTRNCLFLATSQQSFLQAAGLLQLWQQGYVEPITPPRFPAHLAAQQLIATVLQEGRIAKNTCFERLDRVASFKSIDRPTKEDILAHLVRNGFFFEDANFLTIGDASQSEFGRRNFLELVSAFTSPPVFVVLHGTKELGSIDQNLLWNLQAEDKRVLRLAGRDWEITSIDWKVRLLYVTPTQEKGKPMWLGQGEALSYELCQSIQNMLLGNETPAWLTRRGTEALTAARDEHTFLKNNATGCMTTERGLEWHNYVGGHLNMVISQALAATIPAITQSNDFGIVIDRDAQASFETLSKRLLAMSRDELMSHVRASVQWLANLKFSACLPERVAHRVFMERLDIEEWEKVQQRWFCRDKNALINSPPKEISRCLPPSDFASSTAADDPFIMQTTPQLPSTPFNLFFQLPEQCGIKSSKRPGGGAFYARVSQTQNDVFGENGPRAFWRLEGFSKEWFDQNPPPPGEPTWQNPIDFSAYYSKAPIFLLEIEVFKNHLDRFAAFGLIENFAERDDEPQEWFQITAGVPPNRRSLEEEVPMTVFPSLYQGGIALTLVDIKTVDDKTRELLDKAVSTGHITDADDKELTRILESFSAGIDWAVVYDVGQGNSIGLCDGMGLVRGYFDIGGGVGPNLRTFPPALTSFCFSQDPPIILSHWDEDHWSSANKSRGMGALSREWLVPRQTLAPAQVALLAAIASAGGTVWFLPANFAGKWFGQVFLELCSGSGRNHSGIAITISERAEGNGQKILMPGDADYRYIPSFKAGPQYLSVVAPHHGGQLRSTTLPSCSGQAPARLVYSVGSGNTYNHPHPDTRINHNTNGWRDPGFSAAPHFTRLTEDRNAVGLGHVYLGWQSNQAAPPLPCRSMHCQLQAQQL